MFHMIELPPRKFFEKLDGKTDGPLGPGGPIGHAIRSINKNLKPPVNFEQIQSDVPFDIDEKLFNGKHDLKLLLVFVQAVQTGQIEAKYLTTFLPEMNITRWRTTFIRILRLYIQEENPTEQLKALVTYIQKAYAPVCFAIVLHPWIEYGSYHFFNYLKKARACLSREHWDMISREFSPINSYWAHPENLLFCGLLCDLSSNEVKEQSLALILEFRAAERKSKRKSVRKFEKPEPHELNYDATNLFDFINWETIAKAKKTPPPNLRHLSDQELQMLVSKNTVLKNIVREKIPKELCHSQSCEMYVQLTSKTVLKAQGHDKQKSKIIVTQDSREKFSCQSSKADVARTLQM